MDSILRNLIDHFPDLMDLNLTASVVILFVICFRQFLKGAPKIFSYALWGIVLLRLLVPVSIESSMSFVPQRTEFSSMVELNEQLPEIQFEMPQDRADNEWHRENTAPGEPLVQTYRSLDAETYLTFGWLAGIAAMLIYSMISYWKLKRKVRVVVPLEKGVYIADDIDTPFVMGFFRPQIYLPGTLDQTEQKFIIAHEKHHIHRGDHIFKALGFLALTIHWFNPFVWAAFILSGRDMEMSCDEAVIRKLGEDVRAEYSASLLNLATGRRMFSGTPLAFDEGDPTERVRNLARWKKPAVWVILICVITCIVLAVCLLTDPERAFPTEFEQYFMPDQKAELLSGRNGENERTLGVTFEGTSGPRELELELWYQDSGEQWVKGESGIITLQETCKLKIPAGSTFAVAATSNGGRGGYVTVKLTPGHGIVFDEFEHEILTGRNTKSSREEASAWTVPEEAEAVPEMTEESDLSGTYNWGVSLKPDRVSRTGATALFVYGGSVPGQEGAELSYGDFLSLDRRVDGEWVPVDELAGYDYFVGDSSYPVVDGYGMVHEWPDRFGELVDGTYRIGKLVRLTRPDGSWEERMIFGEFSIPDSVLTGPIPLEDLPEKYGAEQAEIDGCVVMRDGDVSRNQEVWQAFLKAVNARQEAFVRTAEYYYDPERVQTTHFIYDIRFDGSRYSVEGILNGKRFRKEYQYLLTFTGAATSESQTYDSYIRYVLSNELFERWENVNGISIDGSILSERLPQVVYTDLIYEIKRPDLPNAPDYASLVFQDSGLITVLDAERLEKLIWLFESAEYLGYEPKTHSIGVGLNLTFTFSNEEFVIELDPDSDLCRINGEYVWYGRPDEPEYTYKLWEYLGITQWPDIVYAVCENALRP